MAVGVPLPIERVLVVCLNNKMITKFLDKNMYIHPCAMRAGAAPSPFTITNGDFLNRYEKILFLSKKLNKFHFILFLVVAAPF